jgi:ribosomal protein S18 acetylase RimI-like enzyme
VEQWAIAESWFWLRDCEPGQRTVLVCESDDGDLVGLAACEIDEPTVAYIIAVVVFLEHRDRNGHGAALFDAILDAAEEMTGGGSAWWLVEADNEPMLELSRKVTPNESDSGGYVRFETALG